MSEGTGVGSGSGGGSGSKRSQEAVGIGFRALPEALANKTTFPIGCRVLASMDNGVVALGIVEEVGFIQEHIYYNLGRKLGYFAQEKLVFPPRTPVWVSVSGRDIQKGIVLASEHEPLGEGAASAAAAAADNSNPSLSVRYTVQVSPSYQPGKMATATTILTNISTDGISYRPTQRDTGKQPASVVPPVARPLKRECNMDSATADNKKLRDAPPRNNADNSADNPIEIDDDDDDEQDDEKDKPAEKAAINQQRNPFRNIRCGPLAGKQHGINTARKLLNGCTESSRMLFLDALCLNYHLFKICKMGKDCHRAESHKDLTDQEAKRLEQILAPVTSTKGPIYSSAATSKSSGAQNTQPSPFHTISRDFTHRIPEAVGRCLEHRISLPDLCLCYHLMGHCHNGKECKWSSSHRHLMEQEAKQLEQVLAPVTSAHGPIYSAAPTNNHNKDGNALVQNPQPNPFHRIARVTTHQITEAIGCLDSHISLPDLCLYYHLMGQCLKGNRCRRSSSHRHLTEDEARNLEETFQSVIGPIGPIVALPPAAAAREGMHEIKVFRGHQGSDNGQIYSAAATNHNFHRKNENNTTCVSGKNNTQPNPFHHIARVSCHRINEAVLCLDSRYRLPDICLWYHLIGHCVKGKECQWSKSHRYLTEEEAQNIDQVLMPVISPTGPIFAQPSAATGAAANILDNSVSPGHQGDDRQGCTRKVDNHMERDKPSGPEKKRCLDVMDRYTMNPPEKRQRNILPNTSVPALPIMSPQVLQPTSVSPRREALKKFALPAPSFGVDFFKDTIIGHDGSIAKKLGEQYDCNLKLTGSAVSNHYNGSHSDKDTLRVMLVPNSTDRLSDCATRIERLLVDAMEESLRGFLVYLLARVSHSYNDNFDRNIKFHTFDSSSKVSHVDNLASLRGGDLRHRKDLEYLTAVISGPQGRGHAGGTSSFEILRGGSFQRDHPDCYIEVVEYSATFPKVKPVAIIYGRTLDAVRNCEQALRQSLAK